ncbi:MAG: signal peptide peptidase SppA [Bacteroidetes bacterium]|nr:signal peptide peptidase SppA [Bacteroidota bacterium]
MHFFKVVFASALGYILAIVLFIVTVIFIGIGVASKVKPEVKIPSDGVLNMKLNYPLADKSVDDSPIVFLSALDPNANIPLGLNKILQAIDQAKDDDKIKGIILDLTTFSSGYAKISEIRNRLEDFKSSGKFIYAYADYYYFPTYYMASVADSVFINPEGEMSFTGMVGQVSFFAGALEKMGIEVQAIRAGKFKGAVESFTRKNLSPENRLQMEAYINSVFGEVLSKIADSREISVQKLKTDADQLQMRSVNDFINAGYIDQALYRDQFYSTMKRRMGVDDDKKVPLLSEKKYAKSLKSTGSGRDRIAVVYASGDIVGGMGNGTQIASDDMAKTLKSVRLDDKVKAVVFRIDSRGGSSLASDIIWREAKLLAEEKPLIVSMSDVAASGGYYIATPARKILAEPTTITGSIGVFGLIPNAEKLLNDKMGVTFEYIGTGKNSDMGRIDRPLTSNQKEYIGSIIDKIYDTFLTRVADGREMTKEEVHAVAQGRVWTGKMAKEVGLVDQLGGLEDAIAVAAEEAGLKDYRLKELPKSKDPIVEMVAKFKGNSSLGSQLQRMTQNTGFESYIQQLSDIERWGTKQSVQAIMPYTIEIKNYTLR